MYVVENTTSECDSDHHIDDDELEKATFARLCQTNGCCIENPSFSTEIELESRATNYSFFFVFVQLTNKSYDFLTPNRFLFFSRLFFAADYFYFGIFFCLHGQMYAPNKKLKIMKCENRIIFLCVWTKWNFSVKTQTIALFWCRCGKWKSYLFIFHMGSVFVILFFVLKCLVNICLIFHSEFFIFFTSLRRLVSLNFKSKWNFGPNFYEWMH